MDEVDQTFHLLTADGHQTEPDAGRLWAAGRSHQYSEAKGQKTRRALVCFCKRSQANISGHKNIHQRSKSSLLLQLLPIDR